MFGFTTAMCGSRICLKLQAIFFVGWSAIEVLTEWSTDQHDALPGHPADRQHRLPLDAVVIGAVLRSAHAQVRDFDAVQLVYQTVPGRQVSVHHVEGLEVLHPGRHLRRHVDLRSVTEKGTKSVGARSVRDIQNAPRGS